MALVSLFSGAVIGPEGGIGGIASQDRGDVQREGRHPRRAPRAAGVLDPRVGLQRPHRQPAVHGRARHRSWSRTRRRGPGRCPPTSSAAPSGISSSSRRATSGLENYLHLSPTSRTSPLDVVLVVLFGLLGLVLALIAGVMFRVATAFFGRFEGREVERALVAGVIFSAVGMVAPIVLFSGETQIQTVVADPAELRRRWSCCCDGPGQAGAAGGRVQERLPGRARRSRPSSRRSASRSAISLLFPAVPRRRCSSAASWRASCWSCSRHPSWSSC